MCDNAHGSWMMCQQKSSLILKCFWFQRRLLSRGVWGDKNSYDIGVFGFLLIKSWSVEHDGKRFIKILEEPQNDGNVSVSSVQKFFNIIVILVKI